MNYKILDITVEILGSIFLVILAPLVLVWELAKHAPWLLFVAWALYVLFTAEPKQHPW